MILDRDIYVSFSNGENKWNEPLKLDEISTNFSESCPSISNDGKYIFFARYNEKENVKKRRVSNIYWVSSKIIDERKPDTMK